MKNYFKKKKAQLVAAGAPVFMSATAFANENTDPMAGMYSAAETGIIALVAVVAGIGGAVITLSLGEKGVTIAKRNLKRG